MLHPTANELLLPRIEAGAAVQAIAVILHA